MLAVVGLVVLVSGCGLFGGFPDPMVVQGVSVDKDVTGTLLTDGEDVMSRLIEASHASSDKPHCFVSFRNGTDDVANDFLRCGPVRVYGLPRDADWFKVPLSVYASGLVRVADKKGSRGGRSATPSPLASDEKLARPDGTAPGKASAVPSPEPQQAKPDLTRLVHAVSGVSMAAPAKAGLLLGPHFAVAVTRSGSGGVLGSGTAARAAAAGEEFVYAQLDRDVSRPTALTTSDELGGGEISFEDGVRWTVVAGSERHPLDALDRGVLVAEVKKGVDVWLEADDKGQTERLNLRTGARQAAAPFDPLYRKGNTAKIDKHYRGSVTDNDKYGTISMSVTVARAVLTPYDENVGYAPKGKVWLAIQLDDEQQDFLNAKFSPRSYRLTVDGEPVSLTSTNDRLLAAVAPTVTRATFTVQGTGQGATSSFRFDTPFRMKQKLVVGIRLPR